MAVSVMGYMLSLEYKAAETTIKKEVHVKNKR